MALSQEMICLREGIFRGRHVDEARLQEIVAYQRHVHEQMLNSKGPLSVCEMQKVHGKNAADLYELLLPNHALRHLL